MIYLNGTPVNTTIFPDNTSQVWKLDLASLRQEELVRVRWRFSHEGEFMQLAQLKRLLDAYNILAELKIDYLPYGRQDKQISNDACFALQVFAEQLNLLDFTRIDISDPHSAVARRLIKRSRAVYPANAVYLAYTACKADVICYPDLGATIKYSKLYENMPYIFARKTRCQETGRILDLALATSTEAKTALIVDDICDGGGTFILLADALKKAGVENIHLFVTHGIFSKGLRPLRDAGIKRIWTKDGEVHQNVRTQ